MATLEHGVTQFLAPPLDPGFHRRHRNPRVTRGLDLGCAPKICGQQRFAGQWVEMQDQRLDAGSKRLTRGLHDVCGLRRQLLGQRDVLLRTTVIVNDGVTRNAVHPSQGIADRHKVLPVPDQALQNVLHQVLSLCRVANAVANPLG